MPKAYRKALKTAFRCMRRAAGWVSEMRSLARKNTLIYEQLFGALPSDSVQTWQSLGRHKKDFTRTPLPDEKGLEEVQGTALFAFVSRRC